jgi:pimeloyl-ACP methyl ester carboxylesterase
MRLVAPALALLGVLPLVPASNAVTFRTTDGVLIGATFHEASRTPAPAVVLVPMLSRTQADWQPLVPGLTAAGIAVLAMDLRGHGASSGATGGDLNVMALDVQAAVAFLKMRPDVQTGRLAIAGASLGANLAVLVAADDPSVRSIALLSCGLDYRGVKAENAMRRYGSRPAMILAGSNDPYAARSARQLATAGPGIRDLRILEGAGHGTVMLGRDPELARQLVDWFLRTLL